MRVVRLSIEAAEARVHPVSQVTPFQLTRQRVAAGNEERADAKAALCWVLRVGVGRFPKKRKAAIYSVQKVGIIYCML